MLHDIRFTIVVGTLTMAQLESRSQFLGSMCGLLPLLVKSLKTSIERGQPNTTRTFGLMPFQTRTLPTACCPLQDSKLAGAMTADISVLLQNVHRSTSFLGVRPSTVAAAALLCVRKARGVLPVWPSALSQITGLSGAHNGELGLCMAGMQALLRNSAAGTSTQC